MNKWVWTMLSAPLLLCFFLLVPTVYADRIEPSSRGDRVVEIAKGQLGKPYVWGGASPEGFDCSGLLLWAFQQVDVTVPHYVLSIANLSTVEPDDLSTGDIVIFKNTYVAGPSHVGLYLGDGDFIHSAKPGTGVIISSLDGWYWQVHLWGFVRP